MTHEFFDTGMALQQSYNTSLTLNGNLESWSQIFFNRSNALKNKVFKNDYQLTAFCHALKSLSAGSLQNFTDTNTNGSAVLFSWESVDSMNQLRNCFNLTTVTPAEEYWEYVKFVQIFCFAEFSRALDILL